MKLPIFASAALAGILLSSTVLADSDCNDPVADWKPRETLRQQLEQRGWTVQLIKVEDGCYEVRGLDHRGNKFKAKYAPASLNILKLEIDFSHGGEAPGYVGQDRKTE